MRPVTQYEANDGSVWRTEAAALERDALILRCEAVVSRLSLAKRHDESSYSNGDGYIQHPPATRDLLYDALRELGANRDSEGPVGRLLWRAHCIDDHDREWGQPYFAINPDKGKVVRLNAAATPQEQTPP